MCFADQDMPPPHVTQCANILYPYFHVLRGLGEIEFCTSRILPLHIRVRLDSSTSLTTSIKTHFIREHQLLPLLKHFPGKVYRPEF